MVKTPEREERELKIVFANVAGGAREIDPNPGELAGFVADEGKKRGELVRATRCPTIKPRALVAPTKSPRMPYFCWASRI